MKNTIMDLNDHLFAQLERLGDEDMDKDALKAEIDRAEAMAKVGTVIVKNASLALRAAKMKEEMPTGSLPAFIDRDPDRERKTRMSLGYSS